MVASLSQVTEKNFMSSTVKNLNKNTSVLEKPKGIFHVYSLILQYHLHLKSFAGSHFSNNGNLSLQVWYFFLFPGSAKFVELSI